MYIQLKYVACVNCTIYTCYIFQLYIHFYYYSLFVNNFNFFLLCCVVLCPQLVVKAKCIDTLIKLLLYFTLLCFALLRFALLCFTLLYFTTPCPDKDVDSESARKNLDP